MTDEIRIRNAIGLARRAGKCVTGDQAAELSMQRKQAKLLIVDRDASENTRQKYEKKCHAYETKLLYISGVGASVGKEACRIVAVTDEGFAEMIGKLSQASENEDRRMTYGK